MTAAGLVLFFLLFGILESVPEEESNDEGVSPMQLTGLLNDEQLTNDELGELKSLECEDIKRMLETDREACIYFRDAEGNIVDIEMDGSFGVGCPGLVIDGQKICIRK